MSHYYGSGTLPVPGEYLTGPESSVPVIYPRNSRGQVDWTCTRAEPYATILADLSKKLDNVSFTTTWREP